MRDLFHVAVPSQENPLNAFTSEINVNVSAMNSVCRRLAWRRWLAVSVSWISSSAGRAARRLGPTTHATCDAVMAREKKMVEDYKLFLHKM